LSFPASAVAQEQAAPDSAAQADSTFPQPPFSAGGAFWRSLIIPGWAQSELGAKSRGAFYFFAEAFSLFMVARTEIRLQHAERNLPSDHGVLISRRQQKEDWIALAVFWAFFAAADGWVSVHLYGFDEKTSVTPGGLSAEVTFRIPFAP
jgi:hypothetical protein